MRFFLWEFINYNGKFKIIEKILAGENKDVELKLGETIRVFTGARLPKNAQTVIMQENAIEENTSTSDSVEKSILRKIQSK